MSITTPHKFQLKRLVSSRILLVLLILFITLLALFFYLRHRNQAAITKRKQIFVNRFQKSFNSGLVKLSGKPEIEEIQRILMPEIGPTTVRQNNVNEYIITAKFMEGKTEKWGRWLYTCNGTYNDGIFKYSYSTASERDSLPIFPLPLQVYIPWTNQMVDGIPMTAGPSAFKLNISSPIKITDSLVVKANSPPGTECRIKVFPKKALISQPQAMQPKPDGSVKWMLNVKREFAGSRLTVNVYCVKKHGTKTLENFISGSVEILP